MSARKERAAAKRFAAAPRGFLTIRRAIVIAFRYLLVRERRFDRSDGHFAILNHRDAKAVHRLEGIEQKRLAFDRLRQITNLEAVSIQYAPAIGRSR